MNLILFNLFVTKIFSFLPKQPKYDGVLSQQVLLKQVTLLKKLAANMSRKGEIEFHTA